MAQGIKGTTTNFELVCQHCDKPFTVHKRAFSQQKYCSFDCKVAASKLPGTTHSRRKERAAKRPLVSKPCELCGTVFTLKPMGQHARYCSKSCALKSFEHRKQVHIEDRECEHCGVMFRPRQRSAVGRFCSKACRMAGQVGDRAANYNGGRHTNSDGYVKAQAPGHPRASGKGHYVYEHILVMEQHLGRLLTEGENVHHKNGNRTENAIGNLELWVVRQPKGRRAIDMLAYGREIVAELEPIEHLLT